MVPVVCQLQCLLDDLGITKFISLGAMQCLAPVVDVGDLIIAKDATFAVDGFSRMLLKSLFEETVKNMTYLPNQPLLAAVIEELKRASVIRCHQRSVATAITSSDGYLKTQKDRQLRKRGIEAIDYTAAANYLYGKISNIQTLAVGVDSPRVDPKTIVCHHDTELPTTELYDADFATKMVTASHPLLKALAN